MEILKIGTNKELNKENSENSWCILLQSEGKAELMINDKKYRMDKRDICIIPPEYKFKILTEKESVQYYFLTNEFRAFGEYRVYILRDDIYGSIREVFVLMMRYWDKRNIKINRAVIKSLGDACYHMLAEQYAKNDKHDYRLGKIIDMMYGNIENPEFDLGKCLESSGYSIGHLRKLFLKTEGVTSSKYMNRIRIERAKSQIQQYGYSRTIKEIAFSCGFRDALYFSRVFHKLEGIGPKAYRDIIMQENADQVYSNTGIR